MIVIYSTDKLLAYILLYPSFVILQLRRCVGSYTALRFNTMLSVLRLRTGRRVVLLFVARILSLKCPRWTSALGVKVRHKTRHPGERYDLGVTLIRHTATRRESFTRSPYCPSPSHIPTPDTFLTSCLGLISFGSHVKVLFVERLNAPTGQQRHSKVSNIIKHFVQMLHVIMEA